MTHVLDESAVKEFFDVPADLDLQGWLADNYFYEDDQLVAQALWYAKEKYPNASLVDICSFATVVGGLTTGWWKNYGTDLYEKEHVAANAAIALAGGIPPNAESLIGLLPAEQASAALTKAILGFLEEFYFRDSARALLRVTMGMSPKELELFALAISIDSDALDRVYKLIEYGKLTLDSMFNAIGMPLKKLTAREFLEWAGWEGDLEEGLALLGRYLGKGTQHFRSFPDAYVVNEDGIPLHLLNDEPFMFQEYVKWNLKTS